VITITCEIKKTLVQSLQEDDSSDVSLAFRLYLTVNNPETTSISILPLFIFVAELRVIYLLNNNLYLSDGIPHHTLHIFH